MPNGQEGSIRHIGLGDQYKAVLALIVRIPPAIIGIFDMKSMTDLCLRRRSNSFSGGVRGGNHHESIEILLDPSSFNRFSVLRVKHHGRLCMSLRPVPAL